MIKKNTLMFFALQFLLFVNLFSQNTVTGTVSDSVTMRTIEFASVSLIKNSGEVQTGTMTDSKGKFFLNDIAAGVYFLRISSVGYITKSIKQFSVSSKGERIDLGNISIVPTEVNLEEISVTSNKIMLNNSIDRKVSFFFWMNFREIFLSIPLLPVTSNFGTYI